MTPPVALPALLAGAAAAVAVGGLPTAGQVRLQAVRPAVPRAGLAAPAAGTGAAARLVPALAGAPGVAVGAVLAVVVAGPVVALLLTAAVLAGRRVRRRRTMVADSAAERSRAVEACAALAAELRAGRTPAEALAEAAGLGVGPFRDVLRAAAGTAGLGGDVAAALLAPPARPSAVSEVLRGLAACWQVCATAGHGLSAAVDRLAEGLRARQAQERSVAAALAGPRATAGLLALLPVVGIALAAALGAQPLHVLLQTPLGLVCLVLGVGLDAVGLWWTGRLVEHAARAVR